MKKAEIYANLNKGGISVRVNGKVTDVVTFANMINIEFIVQRSGYERTIKEKQRNVHAFARGTLCDTTNGSIEQYAIDALRKKYPQVKYNPFRGDCFTVNGEPITKARRVVMVLTERKNERNRPLCEMFLIEE